MTDPAIIFVEHRGEFTGLEGAVRDILDEALEGGYNSVRSISHAVARANDDALLWTAIVLVEQA